MASRGYDYGGGSGTGTGTGTGGKIRRRPPSRAAVASPYARPAPAPPTAAASQGGGWLSRIIAAGASRLLPSLFRKLPPQLTVPSPPPLPLDMLPSLSEPLDAPPSPLPPPLEDDLPEGVENSGVIDNDLFAENTESSARADEEDMPRNSDDHGGMELEELLKQRTFTRSEFEYLAKLLRSRTIGSSSLQPEDGNIKKMDVCVMENGSKHSNLPLDFSIRTYTVADQVASPAEIAKAYMGSKSSKGSPLRLRLHDPSSLPVKLMEANMMQSAKPPTIPLLQGSRLHASKTDDGLESTYATPNRSEIYEMSSSPYFKSGVSSMDLSGTVSSSYLTPSSVHSFGRQVLKRKSSAISNETLSVGSLRKMHQRFIKTSPLLERRPGYSRYLGGNRNKLIEYSKKPAETQKHRCLDKVGDATLGGLNDKSHLNKFGQAPVHSTEMAAKILKQLDTLVPSHNEETSAIKQKNGNSTDIEDKEVLAQRLILETSLYNGINGNAQCTPASVAEKCVGAEGLMSKSISQSTSLTPKDKSPIVSLRSHAPSNLVLSNEIDQKDMLLASNGFTFPVPAVLGAHTQAPPTPTMASPPVLLIEKQSESCPRISKSVSDEVSIVQKFDNNLNSDDKPMSLKNSGQGASFTGNPVFKKPTTLSSGFGYMVNSTVSGVPSNGSTNSSPMSTQNSSTGGSFNSANTTMVTLSQSVAATSMASASTGSPSAHFGFSPLFGTPSSSAAQNSSKAVSSSTQLSFSHKLETASSSAAQAKSEAVSSSIPFSFSQQIATTSSCVAQDKSKGSSAPLGFNPSTSSSVFSLTTPGFGSTSIAVTAPPSSATISALGSTSIAVTAPPSSATISALGSSPVFSASTFGTKLTTAAPPSFALSNTGSATSFSSTPSAMFSFSSATPSIPNLSPMTPMFGGVSPSVQMNGGTLFADRNASPFSTTSPIGIPNTSLSTPVFSTPATQFASETSASSSIYNGSQQGQASSVEFSMGTGGGNHKSGRRFLKVKRRK